MAVSESQVLGVILSGGQKGDAPVGEEMLAEVLVRPEIKAVGADRAYDSDAIRAMIVAAGKEAVIPPRANRVDPLDYDKQNYEQRNKAERLFCKLKGYRAVATRYDKLAAMFLGGVLATLLAVSLACRHRRSRAAAECPDLRCYPSGRICLRCKRLDAEAFSLTGTVGSSTDVE